MSVDYPEALWLLAVLPVIAVAAYFGYLRSRARLQSLVGTYIRDEFFEALVFKRFLSGFAFTLTLAFLVVALSDPHWGERSIEDERRGLEIVYLIDVSNSMRAEDILPNRITRSREVARAVQSRIPDAYAAVIAFKGDVSVVSPMTEDSVAFELAMDYLSGPLVTTPGTDVERGLRSALELFPSGTNRRKVVLLFTDGQELTGDQRSLVREIVGADVAVVSIVAGTPAGALIPLSSGGVLRDQNGNPVIAGVDEAALAFLAEQTGGIVQRLDDTGVVGRLTEYLGGIAGSDRSVAFRVVGTARFRVFLILAVLSMAAGIWIEARRWSALI